MANALSKSQLAAAIAEKAEISKKQAVEIIDHIAALAYKHAKDTFTLPGIGKLVLKNRAARHGPQPQDRRNHPDPGQTRRQVPRRQSRERRHPRRQVIAPFPKALRFVEAPFLFGIME